jgi:predicted enzyme related to lactoylglutathione lyase
MTSSIEHVFAGVATADYARAIEWYERLFGRPPDVIVKDDEAMWQAAGAGWVYVTGNAEPAGNALITFLVHDLDVHVAELAGRGITGGAMETLPGVYRKAVFTDPDGSIITFGETLSPQDDA